MKFLTDIDLNGAKILNMRLDPRSSPPTGTAAGQMYYSSTTNRLYVRDAAGWRRVLVEWDLAETITAVSLSAPWVNNTIGWPQPGVKKRLGEVFLTGTVSTSGSAAGGSVITTLPAGFRPRASMMVPCVSSAGIHRVDVEASGRVVWSGPTLVSGGWTTFNTSFLAT